MLLTILTEKKLLESFTKNLVKTYQKELRVKKIIKGKGDNLCAKWRSYDNSFNSSIDKKDSINE